MEVPMIASRVRAAHCSAALAGLLGAITVRLKADTTASEITVRLKADTTYGGRRR
jgi:hypothetical protein